MAEDRLKRLLKLNDSRRNDSVKQITLLYEISKNVIPGVDDNNFNSFTTRVFDLPDTYKKFLGLHDDIKEIYIDLGEIPPDKECDLLSQVQDMYYECVSKARKCGLDLDVKSTVNNSDSTVNPKLAPIKLPLFSGNIDNFTQWYDLFLSLIHNNKNLSAIHKYHYFISSLSGQALTLVKSIQFDAAHYELAFETLVKHYKNDKLLAMRYIDNIINAKPVKAGDKNSLELFINIFSENVKALRAMEIPSLDQFILFYLASRLIDSNTLQQFEWENKDIKFPTSDRLIDFGLQYVNVLRSSQIHDKITRSKRTPSHNFLSSDTDYSQKLSCVCCLKGQHELASCFKFKSLSVKDRVNFVRDNKLCFICFDNSHMSKECSSNRLCKCNKRHNYLLCFGGKKSDSSPIPEKENNSCDNSQGLVSCSSRNGSNVLLGTVIVNVKNKYGVYFKARCLLDSGSMSSFCSREFFRKLKLPKKVCSNDCVGIGDTQLNTSNVFGTISISPLGDKNIEFTSDVIITPQITSSLPPTKLPAYVMNQFKHLKLSDRLFNVPARIDILLGANLYPVILSDAPIVRKGSIVAIPTVFGYCVTGPVPDLVNEGSIKCNFSLKNNNTDLTDAVAKFWEIESSPGENSYSKPEDVLAEKQFEDLHFRSDEGRYFSPLLVKPNISELGDSFVSAKMRFLKLEKTLGRFPDMKREYNAFMAEYRDLGHMKKVTVGSGKFYIPHHPVIKECSTTTKLRVVFDGSAVTTSGTSLNSCLYSGPKLNSDICDIILRFRLHRVALVADICKMYRMVNIIPDHRAYQHILFRFDSEDPIEEWELNTNTYGLTSASYIAHKSIMKLNSDEGDSYPLARAAIPRDLFVDDLCSGTDDVESAKLLVEEIIEFLKAGGFKMRKWISNEPSVLADIPDDLKEMNLNFDKNDSGTKLLGVYWNSISDSLSFQIFPVAPRNTVTKRIVLSITAKLFDPLGFVAPVVFLLKHFFQTLWKMEYDWDDPVDEDYCRHWVDTVKSLDLLSQVKIPRFVGCEGFGLGHCQLLGFSDASIRGYSCVAYLRVGRLDEEGRVSLLMAKSRLAPLKTLTIPRLELLGAHLLKTILCHLHKSLSVFIKEIPIYAWTDSSIVLNWINTPPYKLKVFVAHRIADIIDSSVKIKFSHVNSDENPAHLACNGLTPNEILNNRLWFNAPSWCSSPMSQWSQGSFTLMSHCDLPEIKGSQVVVASVLEPEAENCVLSLMDRVSSYLKLVRVVSYVIKFINIYFGKNARFKDKTQHSGNEFNNSLMICVKAVQKKFFASEIKLMKANKPCSKSIQSLCPFIDSDGVLRVGGRLTQSKLPIESKHPILLPKHCPFNNLIIDHFHRIYLHVGPSTLVSILRRRFWILSARSVVRYRIQKCISCVKFKASTVQPLMGQLPEARVVPSRVFSKVGIDYAGPLFIKEHKRKGAKIIKCYLVVFVCFSVKAVHLEIVTEMSTPAFLDVFDRFCARRGLPSDVFSDCGTNFKGSARYFSEVYQMFLTGHDKIKIFMANKEINWHFNSPAAPAMGGIWEAAVKSVKGHLRKTIGENYLTYEEMSTLTHRVEAVLNSRPLTSVSGDPAEVDVLTPGHFLIGGPLVSPPEPCLLDEKEGILKRWQLVRRITQSFWSRWSSDYLNILQQRSKWYNEVPNLTPGTVVLVKSENTLPCSWTLGRVDSVFPGPDSVVRVVDVRVNGKLLRRPVNKLVPLPTSE